MNSWLSPILVRGRVRFRGRGRGRDGLRDRVSVRVRWLSPILREASRFASTPQRTYGGDVGEIEGRYGGDTGQHAAAHRGEVVTREHEQRAWLGVGVGVGVAIAIGLGLGLGVGVGV